MADRKKISKKTLAKAFHHWYYGHLTCFSQEHMQTFGYLTSMLPIVEEMYDTKEEQKDAMQTYTAFFNTEPQLGSLVVGITAGLEEARANGDAVDGETINGMRAGLMGPIAGIGDSLIVGTEEIRKALKEVEDESLVVGDINIEQYRHPGNKVLIVKEIMGQGAMHDNLILPVEPVWYTWC